jgi:hypothetical protein
MLLPLSRVFLTSWHQFRLHVTNLLTLRQAAKQTGSCNGNSLELFCGGASWVFGYPHSTVSDLPQILHVYVYIRSRLGVIKSKSVSRHMPGILYCNSANIAYIILYYIILYYINTVLYILYYIILTLYYIILYYIVLYYFYIILYSY